MGRCPCCGAGSDSGCKSTCDGGYVVPVQNAADWDHETEILFRGETRTVFFEHEGDRVIIWCFEDEDICQGADATEEERNEVYQALWEYLEGWWDSAAEEAA